MKLEQIYQNDINRAVNPAVTADDFNEATVHTEIEEYVFTEENLQGMYDILSAIRLKNKHHDGIWINGHYGSGKSHFLKYLNYCMDHRFQSMALTRLEKAVSDIDPMQTTVSFDSNDVRELISWLREATIDVIAINLATSENINIREDETFLDIYLRKFNQFCGYNEFSLELAQYLEKPLRAHGQLEAFHQRIEEEGFDWKDDASTLAATELPFVLSIAKELVSTLDIEEIERQIKQPMHLSVESFSKELARYIADKGDNYRLIFLTDEVSQFINNRRNMMLQLQGVVEELHTKCGDNVWVACTAQQDLSEIVDGCHIAETTDDYGKIMGRFEVKVSLKSTTPEYITQKRILAKKREAVPSLQELYKNKRVALEQQFDGLPAGYHAFVSADDFVDYYPFVPYQFTLMVKVFEAFVNRKYVVAEVRGSERSIIKVTHSIAQETHNQEIGDLISFDQFFGSMFNANLTAMGANAIRSANDAITNLPDKEFAQRVVNILFMLCNMNEADKVVFSATIPNITKLLMRDVDANKQSLMDDVKSVIETLKSAKILQESNQDNLIVYSFYTEDQREVAIAIESERVDRNTMATQLQSVLANYVPMQPRETYATGSFTIGASVMERNFLSNNANVNVEFLFDSEQNDAQTYALQNSQYKLVFFMTHLYAANRKFRDNFLWYCKADKYLQEHRPTNDQRTRTLSEFRAQLSDIKREIIDVEIRKMFDAAQIISGNSVLANITDKGAQRYKKAVQTHLQNVYSSAELVMSHSIPKDSNALRTAILRLKNPGEYDVNINPLTEAELCVQDHILRDLNTGITVTVKEICDKFANAPYGWNNICTLYVINELVRRNIFEYQYNNTGNVDKSIVANQIVRESTRFTIVPAQQISTQLISDFTNAWGRVFGVITNNFPTDSVELFGKCKLEMSNRINTDNDLRTRVAAYPFVAFLNDYDARLIRWNNERDMSVFFQLVIDEADEMLQLVDQRKKLTQFCDHQLNLYKDILSFVDSNRDNWQYLPESNHADIDSIRQILQDKWPIDSLMQYKQQRDRLKTALDDVRKALRDEIRNEYSKAAEDLNALAQQLGVQYTSLVDSVIISKQQSTNIATLMLHRDTSSYFAEEVAKIQAIAKPRPIQGGNSTSGNTSTTRPNFPKQVRLHTRSTSVLSNEKEIDVYLSNLRQQLINELNNGNTIIVL